MSDKSDVARQATFVASKVSEKVFEVDTMKAKLEAGDFKIGSGKTAKVLAGRLTPGQKLPGLIPIADDNALLLHDKSLKNWKEAYTKYVSLSKLGAIILAGDAKGFSAWAKSDACRDEVAKVPDGRLFALIDSYIVYVEAQANTGAATVANGKGSIVFANGDYYVGELKDSKKHGEGTHTFADGGKYVGQWENGARNGKGTYTFADGGKYVGQWKDGKKDGEGTYTWADGDKYVGQYKDGKEHGLGRFTFASGKVMHDGEWVNGEPKK